MTLDLPRIAELEHRPDPKEYLYERLRIASGLHGRRLKKFSTVGCACRVAERLEYLRTPAHPIGIQGFGDSILII